MITLTELIQFTSLLISVVGLFYLIGKDNHGIKKNPPPPGYGYFSYNVSRANRLSVAPFYKLIILYLY